MPEQTSSDEMSVFRPVFPNFVRNAGAVLDRAAFSKTIPLAAVRVFDNRNLSKFVRGFEKAKEIVGLERIKPIRPDPDTTFASKGGKCILLHPRVKPEDPKTWSTIMNDAVEKKEVDIIPYNLHLDYDYWSHRDIMEAILPEDEQGEIPGGFTMTGHVAHLNLRDEYLKYKKTIAEVIKDKNKEVTTVINKINGVGSHSEFRTFEYEVLAGEDDMNVEVSEEGCTFKFNFAKVYWNSRLQAEHKRLVELFSPGEVVCDVMAGIGPFACPAGKKKIFVYSNDLNPESFRYMKDAIALNKVGDFVRPFNEDGHKFIPFAADNLLELAATNKNTVTIPGKRDYKTKQTSPPTLITMPKTITHFVMNLPANAIDFVGNFNGLYQGHEDLFEPHTETKLPMVHTYCFSTKSADNAREHIEICERISEKLGYKISVGDKDLTIWDVRDVAPNKRMFCASFRIPAEVAFRSRSAAPQSS